MSSGDKFRLSGRGLSLLVPKRRAAAPTLYISCVLVDEDE